MPANLNRPMKFIGPTTDARIQPYPATLGRRTGPRVSPQQILDQLQVLETFECDSVRRHESGECLNSQSITHPTMTQIVLYGYPTSPYYQKVILVLNFLKLPFSLCAQPRQLPRPDFASVGINYRRIPLLSIDGHVRNRPSPKGPDLAD